MDMYFSVFLSTLYTLRTTSFRVSRFRSCLEMIFSQSHWST